MNYEPKPFVEMFQNLFCRFFGRKLRYLLLDNRQEKDIFLMTNVPYETILVYDDSPKYSYHKLIVKDTAFLDDFQDRFPVLFKTLAVVDILKIATLLKPETLSQTAFRVRDGIVFMRVLDDETDVGLELIPMDADSYWSYFKAGKLPDGDVWHTTLTASDLSGKELIRTVSPDEKSMNIILQAGVNIPALNTYAKAAKDKDEVTLQIGRVDDTYLVSYFYDGNKVSATGTQHGQRWFILK